MRRHLLVTIVALLVALACLVPAGTLGSPAAAALSPAAPAGPAAAQACPGVPAAELRGPRVVRFGITGSELQQGFFADRTGLKAEGYRPRRLTAFRSGNRQLFATIWVRTGGPGWTARFGLTEAGFDSLYRQLRGTHRPIDVSGYNTPGGAVRFAVVWERNPSRAAWKLHANVTRDAMQGHVNEYGKTGWFPLRVEGYQRGGRLNYASIWVKGSCGFRMHNRMTRAQYQQRLDSYAPNFRLAHLDAFVDGGQVYYAGIWWRRSGPAPTVRSDRDWYTFQRQLNNNRCQGRALENLYASEVPGAVRYGGVWLPTGAAAASANSPLAGRVAREVECAPGRAGAAVLNLTTGEQVLSHADTPYGTSSTIKSAILYALLRRIDATDATLDTRIDVRSQYGANQGNTLTANTQYTLRFLATTMIQNSNNWATNRLIDWVGRARINQELLALGLPEIQLRRYMMGAGSPSTRSRSGPGADYRDGADNTATPRQYARFLQLMHANVGRLGATSLAFFWDTLGLNGAAHAGVLNAGVGADWATVATVFEKAGNNTFANAPRTKPQLGAHLQRSNAGRIVLANGQVIVYAAFVDEADSPNTAPLQNMLSCIVMHAVREYVPQTTGANVAACRAG